MKKPLILIFACFLIITVLSSCISQLLNPYLFPIKEQEMFDGKKTGLSAKLNINGYFVKEDYIDTKYGEDDREWNNLIFLEDGTYARFGFKKEFLDTLQSMDNVIQLNRNIKKGGKYDTYWGAPKGYYVVHNDTIVAKSFVYDQFVWTMEVSEYLILDKNTIKLIKIRFYDGTNICWDANKVAEYHGANKHIHVYHFHPAIELPSSVFVSIKRKKWFWKNKEDWKAHKKLVKQKKKELKQQKKIS
ncbi:MAG: hypothetical protein J6C05_10205 [Prevotella sp.]|nr:hypothetical protein [Prevotella sp.]